MSKKGKTVAKKRAKRIKDDRGYVPIDPSGRVRWRFAGTETVDVQRLTCWVNEMPIDSWPKLEKKGWRLGRCVLDKLVWTAP